MSEADDSRTFLQERRYLNPKLALAHRLAGRGATEVAAQGAWIDMSDGREVLDLGSYSAAILGHRPTRVVRAVHDQLNRLPLSTRSLANAVAPALAERLVTSLDAPRLRRCWFGLNGSDVVELALKLARCASGRDEVVAVKHGFHGKTLGALATTWWPPYRKPFEDVLAPTRHVDLTVDAVQALLDNGRVAAFIFEPVQGEGGVTTLDVGVLREITRRTADAGAFVIADEIQCGLYRCGDRSLARSYGIDADAILLGKSLGGGVMPLSALVGSDRLFGPLLTDPFLHSSTFSGHPLSCAAGLATLDELDEVAPNRLPEISVAFEELLSAIVAPVDGVRLRGRGLLWGLEFDDAGPAGLFLAELANQDVAVSPCLGARSVVRLMPSLAFRERELIETKNRVRAALDVALGNS